jgi:hypothetical protein
MRNQTRAEIQTYRKRLRATYGSLYDAVSDTLFRHDPIDINYETNTDEYNLEVDTILPRLKSCGSIEDVQAVVYEEFCNWFDAEDVGSPERYRELATEIWQLWQNHK